MITTNRDRVIPSTRWFVLLWFGYRACSKVLVLVYSDEQYGQRILGILAVSVLDTSYL